MTSGPPARRAAIPAGIPLIALLVALACVFLWRIFIPGEAFVPAELLRYVAPWSVGHGVADRPPWNPLQYDSVGAFLPWRMFAARSLRAGTVPLWNPHAFCGAPFLANVQSAVFYPGTVLVVLFGAIAAAGVSALLHLTLAAAFMWLFLRRIGAGVSGALLGAIAYAYSTWQVSWLHLPTFLQTTCWLPLALLLTLRLLDHPGVARTAGLGAVIGVVLLGGHLQVAFYVLLATVALGASVCMRGWLRSGWRLGVAGAGAFVAACALGLCLAAPQLVPSVELSRMSHRAGRPSAEGYAAYTAYAVPVGALATVFVPDFYGNPSNAASPYFGTSRGGMLFNYAEGALYVGLLPLLLAPLALIRGGRGAGIRWYLAGIALLALLMALGTAVDAAFYWLVPGFSQSGSPGRALVLWAFAVSALAGLGLDRLVRGEAPKPRAVIAIVAGVVIAGAAMVWFWLPVPQEMVGRGVGWEPQIGRQAALLVLSCLVVLSAAIAPARRGALGALAVVLVAVDLFATGMAYNPTARAADVYPRTELVARLGSLAGHDRVMPVNRGWSFAGPEAVLPPNTAMAVGLRDVQGYDSLFPKQYRAFLARLGGRDPSPPEVGNMVFARDPISPLAAIAGVRVVVGRTPLPLPNVVGSLDDAYVYELPHARGRVTARSASGVPRAVRWLRDEPDHVRLDVEGGEAGTLMLADQWYPGWVATVDGRRVPIRRAPEVFRTVDVPAGAHTVAFEYRPTSYRVGLFAMLLAAAFCAFACTVAVVGVLRERHVR